MEAPLVLAAQQAAWLLLALQYTHDAIVMTDPLGLITWTNPGFHHLCGYTFAEVLGRKPGEVLQGSLTDPATVQRIRVALAQPTHCREDILNYHKDGHPYWVSLQITPIMDMYGGILQFVAIERDITPDQDVEAERRRMMCEQPPHINHNRERNLILICSACKRIYTEQGVWQQMEHYISAHTQFDFSHGLCLACIARLYPDL